MASLEEIGVPVVDGIKTGGIPIGSIEYIQRYLDKRMAQVDKIATLLEKAATSPGLEAPWQGLLSLVQTCIAPSQTHLARDFSLALLAPSQSDSTNAWQRLRSESADTGWLQSQRTLYSPASSDYQHHGGASESVPSVAWSKPPSVGAAALIGPAVKGLVPQTDFKADTVYKSELSDALHRLQRAIRLPDPRPQQEEEDDDAEEDDSDSDTDVRPRTSFLQKLDADSIYRSSRRKVQSALSDKVAALEATLVQRAYLDSGDKVNAARFVDRWQRGASAWLNASRKDTNQHLKNPYLRVAVGGLLGVNCFADVSPATPCPLCKAPVGPCVAAHRLSCRSARTGDNNRRHNAVQQALLSLLRAAGGQVVSTPGVESFTGAEPSSAIHKGRMLDLGVTGLDDGPSIALDLCLSDCGTGNPPKSYKTGAKCAAKGNQKRAKYMSRFPSISETELCCPSYGATGSKNEDAADLHKRIIKALASANRSTPRALIAARVHRVISVAIQRVVAFNALDYRHTKLKGRVVGCGAQFEGSTDSTCSGGDDWDDDDEEGGEQPEGIRGSGEQRQSRRRTHWQRGLSQPQWPRSQSGGGWGSSYDD